MKEELKTESEVIGITLGMFGGLIFKSIFVIIFIVEVATCIIFGPCSTLNLMVGCNETLKTEMLEDDARPGVSHHIHFITSSICCGSVYPSSLRDFITH